MGTARVLTGYSEYSLGTARVLCGPQANLYKESFKGTRRLHAMLTALEPTKHMVPYFCCGFGLKPWIGNKLV